MSAFVIVDIDIHDPETYEEYKKAVSPTIAAHGGTYVARGGRTEVLEGDWTPKRLVILEFPTMEAARGWWASDDYAPAKALRHKSARANMVIAETLTP